jgi:hypothetical protein
VPLTPKPPNTVAQEAFVNAGAEVSSWNVPDRFSVWEWRKGQGAITMPFVRSLLLAAIFALFSAGMTSGAPLSTYSKESVQSGAGIFLKVQSRCETLRRACANKRELGETGEGNCRRYREECSGRSASYCAHLRQACLYKGVRGEVGEGSCRRYREECRM